MLQLEPLSANWSAADPTSAQNLCLLIGRPAGVLRGAAGVLRARRDKPLAFPILLGVLLLVLGRIGVFCVDFAKNKNRSKIVDLGQIRTFLHNLADSRHFLLNFEGKPNIYP